MAPNHRYWQTRFITLLLEQRESEAYSLLREYVYEPEDVVECIHQLSCLALDFIDDPQLVHGLDGIVRRLEAQLV